jgi:hypothetical protein
MTCSTGCPPRHGGTPPGGTLGGTGASAIAALLLAGIALLTFDGDMAPMVDPVEDVDESDLEAASLDDGDMAPMVDPVEDVDGSDLAE